MLVRLLVIGISVLFLVGGVFNTVHAQTKSSNRGLFITPPRQYLEAEPGKVTKSSITIANLTEGPANVSLSFEQFSVADYTYDYKFEMPKENWIKFEASQVSLSKTESRAVTYDIAVPAAARPGGHYFTLFASMAKGDGTLVRAATVVYVTVKGNLVKESVVLQHSLPLVSFGGDIPYEMTVRNTGNTHFLVYVSGRLHGLTAKPPATETAHLLLPGTIRTLKGTISPPLIIGIYQANYGFRDEDGHEIKYQRYVLLIPPRSWFLLAGLVCLGVVFMRFRRRKRSESY